MSSVAQLTIREATPEDMPRIRELHGEIEAIAGYKMDLPEVGDRAILGYWVICEEDVPIQFLYLEKTVELCFGGRDPRGSAKARELEEEVLRRAGQAGIRFAHCHIPQQFPGVGEHLKGSRFEATGFEHWRKDLG